MFVDGVDRAKREEESEGGDKLERRSSVESGSTGCCCCSVYLRLEQSQQINLDVFLFLRFSIIIPALSSSQQRLRLQFVHSLFGTCGWPNFHSVDDELTCEEKIALFIFHCSTVLNAFSTICCGSFIFDLNLIITGLLNNDRLSTDNKVLLF